MCGIAGIVRTDASAVIAATQLNAMQRTQAHRGPDDAGLFIAPGIGLASLRLAILDLSAAGHMPMQTDDGRYHIVYNGEIYNFRDLRSSLEAAGCRFRSHSDTEVLLHLFAREGIEMLQRLNGMFAFAVWDSAERELTLVRDRLGIKPLYYAEQNGGLLFASEEKALFAAGVDPTIDASAWDELLCFRFVAGERTPYAHVRRLLGGHVLQWRDGRVRISRWWHLADRIKERRSRPIPDPVGWYRDTFDDAVDVRRISDVPIGVLLSGGLDSSSVATALGRLAGKGVKSFTVRFAEPDHDEGPLAREVARAAQLDFHDLMLRPEDLLERLHSACWLNDEPLAHTSDIHLWAIAEYAKPRVTVLLSGEGADETLGGYVRYQPLRYGSALALARRGVPWLVDLAGLRGRVAKLGRLLALGSNRDVVLFNACDVLPTELAEVGHRIRSEFAYRHQMVSEAQDLFPGDLARQAMYVDQHTFLGSLLHRNDRMTMGASIECRVPFLDYRLVEGVGALPSSILLAGHQSKPLLRRALAPRLPRIVQRNRKWGFTVPWGRYFRSVPALRATVERLPEIDPFREGPFSKPRLREVLGNFLAGDTTHNAFVVQLVMLSIWHEACRGGGRSATQDAADTVASPRVAMPISTVQQFG
jgi:asparagine synthase (glutamine-hydrolysing)